MIRNTTTNTTLATQQKLLFGIFEQARGLMFRRKIRDIGYVFIPPPDTVLHITNLFVFQSIDVLWLTDECEVLKKATLKAFQLHSAAPKHSRYVIELPAGSAENVQIGHCVVWDEKAL